MSYKTTLLQETIEILNDNGVSCRKRKKKH